MDSPIYAIVADTGPRGSDSCTVQTCPVSESTYGYYPSRPSNITFLTIFVISLLIHIFQGIRWKSWTFLVALGIGTLMEAVGMVSMRIILPS
jgi:hypothetical protein